ncbi:hypothetical protein Q7P35_011642 [Cladosporium inversicolor]
MHAITLTAVALLSTLAAAQIPGLPTCATSCVGTSFGSCGNLDVKCICSNTELLSGLACCVSTACEAADQEKTIQFANSLCGGQGVNNLPQSATCAAGAASSTAAASGTSSSDSSASATSSASGDSSASSTSSAASESTASSESSTGSASSSAASQTGSSTTSSSVQQSTGGAESLKSGFVNAGLGMVLAGVVAAL